MLYQKNKKHMQTERRLYFLVLLLIIVVFLVRVRVCGSTIASVQNAGLLIRLSDQYTMGKIYDRNNHLIVQGRGNGMEWTGDQREQAAMSSLFGPGLEDTYASRMTIWGMAPELFGYKDERLNVSGLFHPAEKRTGGNIRLTVDKDLQTYIYSLLQEKGYDTASVVVSNWKTGEILAAISRPSFLPTEEKGTISSIFNEQYSPGSTMKVILAAAVLSIDPDLKQFTYNCTSGNHVFRTKGGDYQINCAGSINHGNIGMEDAIAYSCNGYFISLLQQVPREDLKNQLRKWGFDTTISFEQFAYWDQTFSGKKASEIEYLLAAIGQGNCSITPIGLNLCTNVLLNAGKLQDPCLIMEKSDSPQDEMSNQISGMQYEICSEEIADEICEMMLGVTAYGTGKSFYMPNFAAKTGTAQKADEGGNLSDFYTVWTTGGLVTEDTPYSVTVCLDNVAGDIYSTYAGEMAKEILEYTMGGNEK